MARGLLASYEAAGGPAGSQPRAYPLGSPWLPLGLDLANRAEAGLQASPRGCLALADQLPAPGVAALQGPFRAALGAGGRRRARGLVGASFPVALGAVCLMQGCGCVALSCCQ